MMNYIDFNLYTMCAVVDTQWIGANNNKELWSRAKSDAILSFF